MNAVIEASKLTKFYGKSRGVVDLDLEVREGEVFGFLGPNARANPRPSACYWGSSGRHRAG